MTTATETAARVVSKPESTRLYMARRSAQRLIKTPRYPIYGPGGRQVGEEKGETIEFKDGVLRVPLKGKVKLADGRMVPSAEIIEWLDSHPLNGNIQEGFWYVPPVVPEPSQEELDELLRAASEHDVEALQAILAAEEAGFNRPKIADTARGTLERIFAIQDEVQKQLEAERAATEGAKPEPKAEPKPKGQAKA